MTTKTTLRKKIEALIQYLQHFTDRKWYPPMLGFLALIDYFIIVIPTDGILISSTMLKPKRWVYLAFCVAIGSTIGALLLFYLTQALGLTWILDIYPNINKGQIWILMENFFDQYGLLLVFVIAATPLIQQPVVILAALTQTPLLPFLISILIGRLIKSLIISFIGSHTPHLLSKLWGIKNELNEVGIQLKEKNCAPK